jgi:hypothetical protein
MVSLPNQDFPLTSILSPTVVGARRKGGDVLPLPLAGEGRGEGVCAKVRKLD